MPRDDWRTDNEEGKESHKAREVFWFLFRKVVYYSMLVSATFSDPRADQYQFWYH